MIVVHGQYGAVCALLLSMLLLGTWPACLNWAEQVHRRLPAHAYLDFSATFFLSAIFCSVTLGQAGPSSEEFPNFLDQLGQPNLPCVLFAMAGGVLLMVGNLSLQYGMSMAGLAICLPIQASLTVIIGTSVNYFLDGGLNDASLLVLGVLSCCAAIGFGTGAHVLHAAQLAPPQRSDQKGVLPCASPDDRDVSSECKVQAEARSLLPSPPPASTCKAISTAGSPWTPEHAILVDESQKQNHCASPGYQPPCTADCLIGHALPASEVPKEIFHSPLLAILVSALGGCAFGGFSPFFNLATNDQLHLLPRGTPPLTVYTSYFYFSLAFFLSSLAANSYFFRHPPFNGKPSTWSSYLRDSKGRGASILAGLLSGCGNALQFMGGQAAGYAAGDLVQAFPLVSTLWGVLLFREFWGASIKTTARLASMYVMYMAAIVFLAFSAKART